MDKENGNLYDISAGQKLVTGNKIHLNLSCGRQDLHCFCSLLASNIDSSYNKIMVKIF